MISYKAPLRIGVLAGASVLALVLAAPAMAGEMQHSSGSTVNVPQAPDVGHGYRPDPTRKTVGELERDMLAQANTSGTTPQTGAGSSQPAGAGTPMPSGSARPMGDSTSPGSGSYGNTGTVRPMTGTTGSGGYSGAFPNSAANLQVDRVNINDLPPDLQAAVRSRMDRQQTPAELVETTILNRLALMGSEYKLDSAQKVGANYVLRVSTPGGTQTTMLYETSSGTLRQVQM
jgi:hypothetical protein